MLGGGFRDKDRTVFFFSNSTVLHGRSDNFPGEIGRNRTSRDPTRCTAIVVHRIYVFSRNRKGPVTRVIQKHKSVNKKKRFTRTQIGNRYLFIHAVAVTQTKKKSMTIFSVVNLHGNYSYTDDVDKTGISIPVFIT